MLINGNPVLPGMFDLDLEAATSISVSLLILGLGMSIYPPLIARLQGKCHDHIMAVSITTFILVLIAASQAVFFTRRYPDLLYPLVAITLGFRGLSPSIMVATLKKKSGRPGQWRKIRGFLLIVSLMLIFYTFISGMTDRTNEGIAVPERLIMTLAVAYTYARAYLKLIKKFCFSWEENYILFSGLLVGISFVILVPFLMPEFERIYRLTGTVGWLGGFVFLYRNESLDEIAKRKQSPSPGRENHGGAGGDTEVTDPSG